MEFDNTGAVIRKLRMERRLTQKQLADMIGVCDKTISKWERNRGLPDIALLPLLSRVLEADMEKLVLGEQSDVPVTGVNVKKALYCVCPLCGGITICIGNASVCHCGRKLTPKQPHKADAQQQLCVEKIEDEWLITSNHQMSKTEYISFIAFVTGDRINLTKLYPEWGVSVRFPNRGHGMLIWYSTRDGLLYQLI